MDYYYYKDAASATQFFTVNAGALHFDFKSIGVADLTTLKALPLLREAASSTALGADPFNLGYLRQATAWHVQTGAGSMIWTDTAVGVVNDAAIGGAQDDVLRAGAGNDYLVGGAGIDILDGGTGNDLLAGGAGADAYQFSGDFGNDTITDSDGLGNIAIDGNVVSGGDKVSDNVWVSADGLLVYTLTDVGLVIGRRPSAGASAVNGSIRIANWQPGQLGINLSGNPANLAAGLANHLGDERPKIIGVETQLNITPSDPKFNTYAWNEVSWAANGVLVNGVAEADFADVIYGGAGNDAFTANGGNDAIDGGAGDDVISGGAGDDLLAGGTGSDVIDGGAGNDFISSGGSLAVPLRKGPTESWTAPVGRPVRAQGPGWGIYEDAVSDPTFPVTVWDGMTYTAGVEGDIVDAGAGNDWVIASNGSDIVSGGLGDDRVDGMGGNDELVGGDGIDTISGDGLADTTLSYMNVVAGAQHGDDMIDGGAGADSLTGDGGSDQIFGGIGDDAVWGDGSGDPSKKYYLDPLYHGNDDLYGQDGNDTVIGGGKDDSVSGGIGNDLLFGDDSTSNLAGTAHGNDFMDGGAGDDRMFGGGKNDTLLGGDGADSMAGDDLGLALEFHGADYLDGQDGNDSLWGGGGNDTLVGGLGQDDLQGDEGDDLLAGGDGDDGLLGGTGNDTLDGGAGVDFLAGGAGDDTYIVDASSLGVDAQGRSETIDDTEGANTIVLAGADAANLSVHTLASGAMTLSVSATQTLALTAGTADALGSVVLGDGTTLTVSELVGQLSDAPLLSSDSQGHVRALGGRGNDLLTGSSLGQATLSGGRGNDTLSAGGASNTFLFGLGDGQDCIVTTPGQTGNKLTLGAGIATGDVRLSADGVDLLVTVGAGTTDQVRVKDYFLGAGVDTVAFASGTVWSRADIATRVPTPPNILTAGADTYNGTGGNDAVYGMGGNDVLNGLAGNDTIDGGAGDDSLVGGAGSDRIAFGLESGTDTISAVGNVAGDVDTLALAAGITASQVELVRPAQSANLKINLYSNGVISASVTVQNYFDASGTGTQHEIVFADSTVWRFADVQARMQVATAGADVLSGGAWAEAIDGLAGDDLITGEAGNDTVLGGVGDDTLYGDDNNRQHVPTNGFPQAFTATGHDLLQGDAGDDMLYGGAGDDTLYGGTGTDKLVGGIGNDTYRFGRGDGEDRIDEGNLGGGTDTIELAAGIAPADVTLYRLGGDLVLVLDGSATQLTVQNFFGTASAQIERVLFADNTVWDLAVINARVVTGVANAMTGTAGNDVFVVDNAGDTITEGANQGTDTVQSSISWTLGSNLENLTLTGVLNSSATGNTLNNLLIGNVGNNWLDGGAGLDTLQGGAGDDTYHVDDSTGQKAIVELANEGTDTAISPQNFVLPANVENLQISGGYIYKIVATGNSQDNVITARAGDVADGKAGADTMVFATDGAGPSYHFSAGQIAGSTAIVDNAGDKVIIADPAHAAISRVVSSIDRDLDAGLGILELAAASGALVGRGNNLNNTIVGNANVNTLYGMGGNDSIWGMGGADTLVGGTGDDTYYLEAGQFLNGYGAYNIYNAGQFTGVQVANTTGAVQASTVVEQANEGIDTVHSIFDYTLAANLENLVLDPYSSSSADASVRYAVRGTGNELDNVITGNDGDNVLAGLGGNDSLIGGRGNDRYAFDVGGGVDRITDTDTTAGNNDTLVLGAGITPESVTLVATANSVVVSINPTDKVVIDWNPGSGTGVEKIEFADGTVWNIAAVINPALHAPTLALPVSNQTATQGAAFSLALAPNTFSDVDAGDVLSYRATLKDGTALPAWLSFNPSTRTFSGLPGNADVGLQKLRVQVTDSSGLTASAYFDLNVLNINDAPQLSHSIAPQFVVKNNPLTFVLPADSFTDIDPGDSLVYSASLANGTPLPNWLSFNPTTRTFSGTPTQGSADSVSVKVLATDAAGATAFGTFDVTVLNSNAAPTVATMVPVQSATQGAAWVYTVPAGTFADADAGDVLTLQATQADGSALPAWLKFDAASRTFSGTPANADVGNLSLRLTATDRVGASASSNVAVTVINVNDAPTAGTPIPTQTAPRNSVFALTVPASAFTDVDVSDTLTYSATQIFNAGTAYAYETALPAWLTFDPLTRTFSGQQPGYGNAHYPGLTPPITVHLKGTDLAGASATSDFVINIENPRGVSITGTALADRLTGTADDDFLNGGDGNDTIDAMGGGDYLNGDGGDDVVLAGDGTNSLGGGVGNDSLVAGAGQDTLDGGQGIDTMRGGAGDDYYQVDNLADSVIEFAGEGFDTVTSSVSYTLGANLERLVVTGAGTSAVGNELDNVIEIGGKTGATVVVDGGSGADQMWGGICDTTFIVDNVNDRVFANRVNFNNIETVRSSVSYTLLDDVRFLSGYQLNVGVENLTLTGAGLIDANGNSLGNVLTGNGAANRLAGYAGNDTLEGGAGDDTLDGGAGDDVYLFARGDGADVINASTDLTTAQTNVLRFKTGITAADLSLSRVGADLEIRIAGGTDKIVVRSFYGTGGPTGAANPLQRIEFSDASFWDLATIDSHVPGNHAPTVAAALAAQQANEDASWTFMVPAGTFADADPGDTLTFSATRADGSALPSWLSFDSLTRTFSGTPTNSEVGVWGVTVIATDAAGASVSSSFNVSVLNTNDAPTVAIAPPAQSLTAGQGWSYVLPANTFSDVDGGDTLSLSATLANGNPLPSWLSFNAASRTLGGTPAGADVGTLALKLTAADSAGASVATSFNLAVASANHAPVFVGPPLGAGRTGIAVTDIVGDPASYFGHSDDELYATALQPDGKLIAVGDIYQNGRGGFAVLRYNPDGTLDSSFNGTGKVTTYIGSEFDQATSVVVQSDGKIVVSGWRCTGGVGAVGATYDLAMVRYNADGSLDSTFGVAGVVTAALGSTYGNAFTVALQSDGKLLVATNSSVNGTDTFTLVRFDTHGALDLGFGNLGVAQLDVGMTDNAWSVVVQPDNKILVCGGGAAGFSMDFPTGYASALVRFNSDGTVDTGFGVAGVAQLSDTGFGQKKSVTLQLDGKILMASTASGTGGYDFSVTRFNANGSVDASFGSGGTVLTDFMLGSDNGEAVAVQADGKILVAGYTNNGGTYNFCIARYNSNGSLDTGFGVGGMVVQSEANTYNLGHSMKLQPDGKIVVAGTTANNQGADFQLVRYNADGSLDRTFGGAAAVGYLSASEGVAWQYTVPVGAFSDADAGDALVLAATLADGSALPYWLTFDPLTRTFSGTPDHFAVGVVNLKLTATDLSGASVSTLADLEVSPGNAAPVLANPLVDTATTTNAVFSYSLGSLAFTDPNPTDVLSYTAQLADGSALPTWLSFNPTTMTLSGTAPAKVGTVSVKIIATDVKGLSASDVFDIAIQPGTSGNLLEGTAGNDTLTSYPGGDLVYGFGGDDVISALAGNDLLDGGAGNDTLDGGAGNDTMLGGLGDDTYILSATTDVVTEAASAGTDTVQIGLTYTLGTNVENLVLTGTAAINGTGNTLANVLTGNSAANTLSGGSGNDTMDGGAGNDSMVGGAGNDTYVVDATGDVVTEAASAGTDTVQSAINYTLGTNLENLTLTGTANINGTGNTVANTINGNAGNNVIDGGAGNDTMAGGLGDDTYVVNATTDVVTETASAGTDTVKSAVTWTLGSNLENLVLTGTAAINATGNALANYLLGNAGNNKLTDSLGGNDILQGMAGNDTLSDTLGNNLLDGGAGLDTMVGGSGNDILVGGLGNDTITMGTGVNVICFNKGDGQDILNTTAGGSDTLCLGGAFAYSDLSLSKVGNDLVLKEGATDQITIKNWYVSATNRTVVNLQVIAEAMTGFSLGSADPLRNNRIENFDFLSMVAAFDAAGAPANWQLTDTRLTAYLKAGSDTAALGGDIAYQYGKTGTLTGIGVLATQAVLNSAGATPQTLNNPAGWVPEVVKLA